MFLNPVNNCCLSKRDSYPLAGLIRVRIFYRCYSLVLNVEHLETDCASGSIVIAAAAVADVAAVVDEILLVSHKGSLCCMFLQTAMFSNFRMGRVVATQNGIHSLKCN